MLLFDCRSLSFLPLAASVLRDNWCVVGGSVKDKALLHVINQKTDHPSNFIILYLLYSVCVPQKTV